MRPGPGEAGSCAQARLCVAQNPSALPATQARRLASSTSIQCSHRRRRAALQVRDATDVGRDDRLRLQLGQMAQLAVAQLHAPSRAAARSRCRPSRSTDAIRSAPRARRNPARARCRSTPPRNFWPCCSVQGGWKASTPLAARTLARSAGTRSGSSSLRSRVSSLMRRPLRIGRIVLQDGGRIPCTVTPQPEAFITIASTRRCPLAATRRRCWRASAPGRLPGR